MQDVCISFWRDNGTEEMMLKVTDICSTDPNEPSYCATPADIKVNRYKAATMQHLGGRPIETYPEIMDDRFPQKTWWLFVKCWADVFTSFSIFALPNPKPLSLLALPPSPPKNQLTPQFSTRHRASHNPPTKAQKQKIGSQLPTSPITSTGPKPQEWNNTKSAKSPILEEAGQPIPWAYTIRKETYPHLLPTA